MALESREGTRASRRVEEGHPVYQCESNVEKSIEILGTKNVFIRTLDVINQFVLIYEESLNGLMG